MSPADDQHPGPDGESRDQTRAPVRVLVVDDHPSVRLGVIRLISTDDDFEVVGEAADGVEALEMTSRLNPDLVLMDISMPVLDGVAATSQMAALPNPPAIVLFTAWTDRDRIAEALDSGASGYLLKDAPPSELFRLLRAALAGDPPNMGIEMRRDAHNNAAGSSAAGSSLPALRDRVVLFGSPGTARRWQGRMAGGAVAVLAFGSAGVAAAWEGKLPTPIQEAARRVGLPTRTPTPTPTPTHTPSPTRTPSPTTRTKLDEARRALARLDAALRSHDRASIAAADDELRRRLRQLNASDQTRLHASAVLNAAEQQLAATAQSGGPVASVPDDHGGVSGSGGPGPGSTSVDGGSPPSAVPGSTSVLGGSPSSTVPDASVRAGAPEGGTSPGRGGSGAATSSPTAPSNGGGPAPAPGGGQ